MSADLMLICKKRGENFEDKSDKCICVDETSMGDPHTDFGKMIASYSYNTIDDEFIEKVKDWFNKLEHKDYIELDKIIKWLEEHKGESLEYECW